MTDTRATRPADVVIGDSSNALASAHCFNLVLYQVADLARWCRAQSFRCAFCACRLCRKRFCRCPALDDHSVHGGNRHQPPLLPEHAFQSNHRPRGSDEFIAPRGHFIKFNAVTRTYTKRLSNWRGNGDSTFAGECCDGHERALQMRHLLLTQLLFERVKLYSAGRRGKQSLMRRHPANPKASRFKRFAQFR